MESANSTAIQLNKAEFDHLFNSHRHDAMTDSRHYGDPAIQEHALSFQEAAAALWKQRGHDVADNAVFIVQRQENWKHWMLIMRTQP